MRPDRRKTTEAARKGHVESSSSMPRHSTSTLEPVIAGQPKAATLAALKAAGPKLSVSQIASSVTATESARADFTVKAIQTGVLLLAKKQVLRHGEFQVLSSAIWAHMHGVHAPELTGNALHNFARSLRVYMQTAQHFLADLEQGSFQPEIGAQDRSVTPPTVSTDEVLAVATAGKTNDAVYQAIESFASGRSLRRMLIDFRRAETAAEAEEFQEAAEAEGRKRSKKLPEQAAGQMDFLQDFMRPLSTLDTLMSSPTYVKHTTKQFWSNLADKLEAQASKARQMAKEIAG